MGFRSGRCSGTPLVRRQGGYDPDDRLGGHRGRDGDRRCLGRLWEVREGPLGGEDGAGHCRVGRRLSFRRGGYSPECVEGSFYELRVQGVLRTSLRKFQYLVHLRYAPAPHTIVRFGACERSGAATKANSPRGGGAKPIGPLPRGEAAGLPNGGGTAREQPWKRSHLTQRGEGAWGVWPGA
jgi:hypothetical protein